MELTHNTAVTDLVRGKYKFKAVVTTEVTLESKLNGESAFSANTSGVFTANYDGIFWVSDGEELRVQLGAGDTAFLSLVEQG